MPVEKCVIDKKDGYRWGPNGKCYPGESGKQKAEEQGKAIQANQGYEQALSISKLVNIKVGFDYDGTLTSKGMQDIVKKLITAGATKVYIISARHYESGMYALANKLGIPMTQVFATGSNPEKIKKVKELGITKFYDNNQDVIDALPGIGIKV